MEWVEVRGKTVDTAIEAALGELGIEDRSRAEIEVIQEPERGFLGIGGKDAVVRVKRKPARKRRRRGRGGRSEGKEARPQQAQRGEQGARGGGRGGRGGERRPRSRGPEQQHAGGGGRRAAEGKKPREGRGEKSEERTVTPEEQTPVVKEFLEGLVAAFGLEGSVEMGTDGDTIIANVVGEQTEALVGPRGSVMEAVHELTKTVLQRRTQASARLRLDVAGYAVRRREALTIYADRLIDQVMSEGGEVMLEPMSAGDRKVIHDAAAAREGVRSYSEGEAPQRYVVIAREEEKAAETEEPSTEEE